METKFDEFVVGKGPSKASAGIAGLEDACEAYNWDDSQE